MDFNAYWAMFDWWEHPFMLKHWKDVKNELNVSENGVEKVWS